MGFFTQAQMLLNGRLLRRVLLLPFLPLGCLNQVTKGLAKTIRAMADGLA
jgi:hypothetical protein